MKRQFVKLKPYKASRKDYSHHKTHVFLGAPVLQSELLFLSTILDQQNLPQCTAYTACGIRESMKEKKYQTQPFWEAEKTFDGDQSEQGSSIKTLLAVGVKTGFWPLYATTPSDQATAYFFISRNSGMDTFDSIRTAIFQQQRPLAAGLIWYQDFNRTNKGIVPFSFQNVLGGHAVKIAGWKTINGVPYLVIQNSWGVDDGDQGLFYFSRELSNKVFGEYGIGYWSDDPNHKTLGFFSALLQNLIQLYTRLIDRYTPQPAPAPIPAPIINPPELVKVSRIKDWAKAIEDFENSPKWWNNPGSIKSRSGKFLMFSTYQEGFDYLCGYLTRACTGEHPAYPKGGETTLLEFQQIYSPSSDKNNPQQYAEYVATALKVGIDTKIKTLL